MWKLDSWKFFVMITLWAGRMSLGTEFHIKMNKTCQCKIGHEVQKCILTILIGINWNLIYIVSDEKKKETCRFHNLFIGFLWLQF